jgi:microcin-processing metallopeptidase PmbA/TldD-like protein
MSERPPAGRSRLDDVLRRARLRGARAAEVFHKAACGRRTALEPIAPGGSRPRVSVSTFEEEGLALRLVDAQGRTGFAWRSPVGGAGARELVDAALASAGRRSGDLGGVDPREAAAARAVGHASMAPLAPALEPRCAGDLQIDDDEVLAAPAEAVSSLLEQAADAAAGDAGRAALVDKVLLSEARATITLANSLGFLDSYSKTLALLSVSMVPAAPGASSVLEERSSCRLRDLDPRGCARIAALRSLPPRSPESPPGGAFAVTLAPRAAASFIATLVSSRFSGGGEPAGPERGGRSLSKGLRSDRAEWNRAAAVGERGCLQVVDDPLLPGATGSAPFDGVGGVSRRTVLLEIGKGLQVASGEGGAIVRPSFREPPATGLTNVYVSTAGGGNASAADREAPGNPILRIEVARFNAGPTWRMHVLRGEWRAGGSSESSVLGSADGIVWEGPLPTLLHGVAGAGDDLAFFHLGVPIGAPTLAFRGLTAWKVTGERRAARRQARLRVGSGGISPDAPRMERRRSDRRADE